MPKENPKEKCFREAYDAYKKSAAPEYADQIEFQQAWGLRPDGVTWLRKDNWGHAIGSYLNGRSVQIRRPDLSISSPSGNMRVMELKFDQPAGGRDSWGTSVNPNGSGRNQQQDYNHLNEQNGTDYKDDDPSLNPDKCNCDKPSKKSAEPVTIYEVNKRYFTEYEAAKEYSKLYFYPDTISLIRGSNAWRGFRIPTITSPTSALVFP